MSCLYEIVTLYKTSEHKVLVFLRLKQPNKFCLSDRDHALVIRLNTIQKRESAVPWSRDWGVLQARWLS